MPFQSRIILFLNCYSPDKIGNLISHLNLVSSWIHDSILVLVTVLECQYRLIYWNLFVQMLVLKKIYLRFLIDTIDSQYKHNFLWENKEHNLTLYTNFWFKFIVIIKHYQCHNTCILLYQTQFNCFRCPLMKFSAWFFFKFFYEYLVKCKWFLIM